MICPLMSKYLEMEIYRGYGELSTREVRFFNAECVKDNCALWKEYKNEQRCGLIQKDY